MTAASARALTATLRHKHYSFLISTPEHFAFSNGISVLLNAAQSLRESSYPLVLQRGLFSHPQRNILPGTSAGSSRLCHPDLPLHHGRQRAFRQ